MSGRIVNYFHESTECEGYLSIPESSLPAPLVLVAHTWKGRSEFEDHKVVALNNLGYAALSIDIFGGGINGTSVEEGLFLSVCCHISATKQYSSNPINLCLSPCFNLI